MEEMKNFPLKWVREEDNYFWEPSVGLKIWLPDAWEEGLSLPFLTIFRNQDMTDKMFAAVEVLKIEAFVPLERAAQRIRDERKREAQLQPLEICGMGAYWDQVITENGGLKWVLFTAYVKKNNRLYLITAGSPLDEESRAQELFFRITGMLALNESSGRGEENRPADSSVSPKITSPASMDMTKSPSNP